MIVLKSTKAILEEIDQKLEETIKDLNDNSCDLLSEKDFLLGTYEEKLNSQRDRINNLEEKIKKLVAATGGFTKQNNKLKKRVLEEQRKNKDLQKCLNTRARMILDLQAKLTLYQKVYEERTKFKGIAEQQEKIILKMIKKSPTKEKIINYDKKNPLMK